MHTGLLWDRQATQNILGRRRDKQREKKGLEKLGFCHTHFSEENRMHLICVLGSEFHTYDRQMSVISQDIAQNVKKRFMNFYYTHEGRHEGLYTNNNNYEDTTPSSSSTGI
jgi:GTP cyclohydrolase II